MRRTTGLILVVVVFLGLLPAVTSIGSVGPPNSATSTASLSSAATTDTVVVALRPGTDTAKLAKRQKQVSRVEPRTRGSATARVRLKADESLASAITALSSDPDVLYAEPLYEYRAMGVTPTDPLYTSQWGLPAIGAPEAWAEQTGAASVKLAVIDTGVDGSRPDFDGRLVTGWNWVANSSVTTDDNGHGTHVAGIAAATGNDATGVAGVAWGVKVMPLKVLDANGAGYSDNIAAAIRYAADSGCQVVNMSLGATVRSQVVADAVAYAVSRGVSVVAAAGNYGENGNPVCYPAALDGVIAVSSVDRVVREGGDVVYSRSRFSEYGAYVDLAAPGGRILSTMIASRETSGFSELSGTSMAAPYVAGAAALVLSERPDLTGLQVAQVLETSAKDIGAKGQDDLYGAGLLDVASAVRAAGSPLVVTSTNPVSEPGWTNTTTVDIALSYPGATEYRLSEGDLTAAPWRAIEPNTSLTLSSGDGTKTVAAQFRSSASPVASTLEETDLRVTLSGTWVAQSSPKYSEGKLRYARTPGQSAMLSFRGTGADVLVATSRKGGRVRVSVDGAPAGVFDTYDAVLRYQHVAFSVADLAQGEHTLTLEVIDEKHPDSSGTYLNLDGFRVTDATESDIERVAIVLDTVAPAPPVIESPANEGTVPPGQSIFRGRGEAGTKFHLLLEGSEAVRAIEPSGGFEVILTGLQQSSTVDGEYWSADQAGNSSMVFGIYGILVGDSVTTRVTRVGSGGDYLVLKTDGRVAAAGVDWLTHSSWMPDNGLAAADNGSGGFWINYTDTGNDNWRSITDMWGQPVSWEPVTGLLLPTLVGAVEPVPGAEDGGAVNVIYRSGPTTAVSFQRWVDYLGDENWVQGPQYYCTNIVVIPGGVAFFASVDWRENSMTEVRCFGTSTSAYPPIEGSMPADMCPGGSNEIIDLTYSPLTESAMVLVRTTGNEYPYRQLHLVLADCRNQHVDGSPVSWSYIGSVPVHEANAGDLYVEYDASGGPAGLYVVGLRETVRSNDGGVSWARLEGWPGGAVAVGREAGRVRAISANGEYLIDDGFLDLGNTAAAPSLSVTGNTVSAMSEEGTGTVTFLTNETQMASKSMAFGLSDAFLNLPDGARALTAVLRDLFGNTSAESTPVVVTIDTTPPETTLTVDPPDGRFGWYRTAPSVSLTATDAVTGVASTSYSWDATSPMAPVEGSLTAPEGEHTLYAASTDATGNVEVPRAFGFRVDTTAPGVLLAPPAGASALSGPVVLAGGASDANLYSWSIQVGRGSAPSSWVTFASAEGTSTGAPAALFDASHYAKGDYTLRLLATDEAGNTGEARTPVTVATPTTARYYDRALENDHVRLELDASGVVTALRCDLDGSGSPVDDASLLRGASEGASGVGVILDGDAARAQRALAAGGSVTITPYATSTQAGQRVVVDLPAEGIRVTEDWSLTPASEYALCDLRVEVTGETDVRDVSLGMWMRADADEDAPADDLSLLGLASGDCLAPGTIATGTTEAGSLWAALGSEESSLAVGIAAEDPSSLAVRALPEAWPFDRAVTAKVVADATELPQDLDETRRFALLGGRSLEGLGEAASAFTSPPHVTSLSSSFVAPGTEVALTGTGFGASQGASRVTFAGVDAEVLSWTDTAIAVRVPAGVTGGYAGVWRTGVCSNGAYFLAGTPPRVDSLSTDVAPPGSEVVLTGADFGTVAGTVTFSGVVAEVVSWSEDSVTAVVPAGAPAGYVGVWRDGICSNGRFFTPGARPSIADIDPMFAPAGSSVTVEGTGFGAAPGQVTLGGVTCDVLSWNETAVIFRVPEGVGNGYVGVWSSGVCSNGVWFGVTE